MKRVAASEFDLLTVTRALFERPGAWRPALLTGLLRQKRSLPDGMGPTALAVLRSIMGKGIVATILSRGGWRDAESLQRGEVVRGRLWERHQPPLIQVSPFAMYLCRWLTSQPLRSDDCEPLHATPATIADELLLYLALDLAQRANCTRSLAVQPAVRASALCWLGFADVLAAHPAGSASFPPADISVYAFAPWTSGTGAVFLEALQLDLAQRWVASEVEKLRLTDPAQVVALGRIQDAVLRAFFGAIQGAERLDLCRFIVSCASALLVERPTVESWQPTLAPGGSLRARSDAHRASVALLRNLRTVRHWVEQATAVRFFDDEYERAQLVLRMWEELGENGYRRALAIATEIESLDHLVEG